MMKKTIIGIYILLILTSCIGAPVQTPQTSPIPSISTTPSISPTQPINPTPQGPVLEKCQPAAYTLPTLPAVIPGYTELDESIGLHVTGSYQVIDPETYRLNVSGMVDNPLELTYAQIRCLPQVTAKALLVCPGFFEDSASWTGVTIQSILDLAGVQAGSNDLVLVSADGYRVTIPLIEALEQESLLAYEVNEQILPILHGFPVRAVFPDRSGGEWIKWLVEIQIY